MKVIPLLGNIKWSPPANLPLHPTHFLYPSSTIHHLNKKSKTQMELCMEIHFSPILYSESYQIEKINIWAQWINFLAFMAFLALWLKLTSLYGLYSGEKIFIGFLAELGNFKHFEPYLFFWKILAFFGLAAFVAFKGQKIWPFPGQLSKFHHMIK